MRVTISTLLSLVLFAGSALAQESLADLGADAARVSRGAPNSPLTGPSPDSRGQIIANFLRGRHDEDTVRDLVLRQDDPSDGPVQHLGFGQRIAGLDIYGTYARAAFTSRGELLSVVENLVPARALRPGRVSPAEALTAVLARFYPGTETPDEAGAVENTYTYEQTALFYQPPTVTRVAVPLRGSVLDTGYLVETWDRSNVLRNTVVSGRGQIVFEELRTSFDSYRIFPISPGVSGQQVVADPANGTASPGGWVADSTTTGNNVDAYLDRDNNGTADTGGRPTASAGQVFDFTWSGTQAPTTTTNQMAAVTNLFYLNNVLHDRLYGYGFNEAAGNFQTNNFGRGGAGNDSVRAEAQDGGGTNNANFATPGDGSRPRMQMYLWTTANPSRDGDLDSDIVYHEYGHGLTWRMIGNMDGPFAGAIGEGMGDTLAIYFNANDVLAEYSAGNLNGIRRNPYTDYPRTYGAVTGGSVHNDGEIYAATMWRLRENWLAKGRSVESLLTDIVQGMNYTPARPEYEHMRDSILQALTTRNASSDERCDVWDAFADFGIGVGANGVQSCVFNFCSFVSVTQSFDKPAECSGSGTNTAPTVQITGPANGASVTAGNSVTFTGTATDTQQGNLTANLAWTSNINGNIGNGGSFSTSALSVGTHTITASVTDNGGLTGSASITVNVTAPSEITLTVTKSKVKGVNTSLLGWSGATTANVDIRRDSAPLLTTANDGSHTDTTGTKGGRTFTYQVCNANSSTCSAVVSVVY